MDIDFIRLNEKTVKSDKYQIPDTFVIPLRLAKS